MNNKEHMIFGLILLVLLYLLNMTYHFLELPLSGWLLGTFLFIFGSLYPDIDSPLSLIRKKIEYLVIAFGCISFLIYFIGKSFGFDYGLLPFFFGLGAIGLLIGLQNLKHRGEQFHSIIGLIFAMVLLSFLLIKFKINEFLSLFFFFGGITHLFADKFTTKQKINMNTHMTIRKQEVKK